MKRFTVVIFETVCPVFDGKALAKGGGVCFLSEEQGVDWTGIVARIAREHLQWDIGRCVVAGVATLDEAVLAGHCRRFGEGIYWQGGDEA